MEKSTNIQSKDKILLHICCGPCSIYPVQHLREAGFNVRGYFYNPNIHPYTEFQKRLETLQVYAEKIKLPMIYHDDYALEEFLRQVVHREGNRCQICYAMRLRAAAHIAKKGKFPYYTTTLLVSPYQQHELIAQMGEAIGKEYGVKFYYADFRQGYKEAAQISRDLGQYRQQYCGCIYSEKDRYVGKAKRSR